MQQAPWFFFFQAEDGIRDDLVTGVQTCALPIYSAPHDLGERKLRRDERNGNEDGELPHTSAMLSRLALVIAGTTQCSISLPALRLMPPRLDWLCLAWAPWLRQRVKALFTTLYLC